MSSDYSILSSGESEKRWVLAMEKNFLQHHTLHMPFCVYRVPKKLSEAKPEAYAPQKLGFGPLHHLRSDLYAVSTQKIAVITKFFPPEKLHNLRLAVDTLVQLEPTVRACYDQYLDLNIETLAWILAIDALYLLHFLNNYPELKHLALAGDVLMLENQIPLVILHKILQVLELSPADNRSFLDDQSPLELNAVTVTESTKYGNHHLLHQMYFLIVNNRGLSFKFKPQIQTRIGRMQLDDVVEGVQFLADRGLPGAGTASQILSFVNKIPWEKISSAFKKDRHDSSTSADEIEIPSASQMTEITGITFIRTPGGIRDLRFDDEVAEKKFYLPLIKISATTEIVLRNLVAYEAASAQPGAVLELAEFVDLICGIIDSPKDVDILRKAGIVQSELEDDEIARIFNEISKSKKKTDTKSRVEEAVDSVNARYSGLVRVKVKKMAEKYGYGFLKVMSVAITIAVLMLLILQAFCSVFGCRRWFGNITTQTHHLLLSYHKYDYL